MLLSSTIVLTVLNPSPWLASTPALFVRPPPPLAVRSGAVPPVRGCQDTRTTALEARERAAIVLLVREADLAELIPTLKNFELRFNRVFRYPYVFLSSPDLPVFSLGFKRAVARVLPDGAVVEWGEVPEEQWKIPAWMDMDEVRAGFKDQEAREVQYAGREGYHHMCRFYSGLWARHPMLAKYDWYWRLEPGGSLPSLRCSQPPPPNTPLTRPLAFASQSDSFARSRTTHSGSWQSTTRSTGS